MQRVALAVVLGALVALAGCSTPGQPTTDATPTPTPGVTPPPATDGTPDGTGTPTTDGTPTGSPDGTPVDDAAYESYVFDHAGVDAPAIEGGITYRDGDYTTRFYATVVDAASTDRFNHSVLDAEASAFVDDTDFASASIVVIQAFPASSTPDYRVESVRRTAGALRVAINDSSEGATADITVETLLLRVEGEAPESVTVRTEEGRTFRSGSVVTVTPDPTATPDDVSLPYAAEDPRENVDGVRELHLRNSGSAVNGYRVRVVYHDRPDCRDETPACDEPTRDVELLDRRGKLRAGETLTVDLARRTGNYTVTVESEVPDGDGSRVTVSDSLDWRLDESSGHVAVAISDDGVSVDEADE